MKIDNMQFGFMTGRSTTDAIFMVAGQNVRGHNVTDKMARTKWHEDKMAADKMVWKNKLRKSSLYHKLTRSFL